MKEALIRLLCEHPYAAVQRVLGLLLMLFSLTHLIPLGIALVDGQAISAFVGAFFMTLLTGVVVWLPVRKLERDLRLRDGFLIVVAFWGVLGMYGALPFMTADGLSFTDAAFESVSGLTTTGATVMTGLDDLPLAIQYYRQQLQLLGGMGIIVLAVAILPMLGVGGMQLYRAETPGPMKDNKLTPRITETAKALWQIYMSLTLLCAVAYWLAGMPPFDALTHSFSTISTGGFSTHDASIAYYDSALISWVCTLFMVAGGINFGLHFAVVRTGSITGVTRYWRDPETRALLIVYGGVALLAAGLLVAYRVMTNPLEAITVAAFEVVSHATTSGFGLAPVNDWPTALPFLMILVSFLGGAAGSTTGGLKMIRVLLLTKQGVREVNRLVHPAAVLPVKLGRRAIPNKVIEAVWGFFSVYAAIMVVMTILFMLSGFDQVTAFSAVAATLNNLGPGLGEISSTFASATDPAKWLGILGMLLGRLEIFTLLVVFTPAFWRR